MIESEIFLYYFRACEIDYSLPNTTANDITQNFIIHREKLHNACWCKSVVIMNSLKKTDNVTQNILTARLALVEKRIKKLTDFLKKLNVLLPKVNRSTLWMAYNNEKFNKRNE